MTKSGIRNILYWVALPKIATVSLVVFARMLTKEKLRK